METVEREMNNSMQRYVDILSEAGFKAVFGEERNKDVLVDLLNIILPAGRTIREISYATTEIPGFTLANKSIRLDLRCKGDDGTNFIVEMQCYHQNNFFKRCVEYAAKVYDSGTDRGDGQKYELPPVYFIALMAKDAPVFDRGDMNIWADRFVSEYTFREKVSQNVVDETIFLIFVELNRFDKRLEDCETMLDKLCFALKHTGSLHRLPEDLCISVFERLFEACEISKFDIDRKLKYERDMMNERDYYNILETYKADGVAEGRAEGKMEVAKTMKTMGLPEETIVRATGLTTAELAALDTKTTQDKSNAPVV